MNIFIWFFSCGPIIAGYLQRHVTQGRRPIRNERISLVIVKLINLKMKPYYFFETDVIYSMIHPLFSLFKRLKDVLNKSCMLLEVFRDGFKKKIIFMPYA